MLTIGRGWAIYVGPVEAGRVHRHQAVQFAWSRQEMLRLEGAWGVLKASAHILPAGVPHRLVATEPVRIVFFDPTMHGVSPACRPGHSVATALGAGAADLLESELERWLRGTAPPEAADISHQSAEDSRWATVRHWLETALESTIHVREAAHVLGLSSSRFMHWFTERSGLPFRAYVRWLRLQHAVRTLSDGCTLTEAAHLAGFADSAHLTRTFVSTFGIRPALLRGARIVCTEQSKPPLMLHAPALLATTEPTEFGRLV